ncbi:hypothetical protein SYNPS1DRAFT_13850 [Syncephalis pseudoplumigaleata]|uniref:Transposase Tc1-like domain-containing protein n=1 Tax=Syncephalis pseudoplumigaleata TaxID=1712513 RepID=A0A4V1J1Y6_9FUNG|nr:hypothetical protein SYNPS1DRAFT_13850 [Syncephalis pseudoplumigaleata]|eukprot:RKP26689.1 hypothetical protein SYNPS1DRAFT_13850 [Syncephalis pseudoplumigaleata]
MRATSKDIQLQTIKLLNDGLSERTIAKAVGISNSTVNNIKRAHGLIIPKQKGGRAPKLSKRTRHYCLRLVKTGKAKSAAEVARCLKDELDIDVSAVTVRRVLHDLGSATYKKGPESKLAPHHDKARLA